MNIGFTGTGKISSALVGAICATGLTENRIWLSPKNKAISLAFAEEFANVSRLPDNQEVIDRSDLVFIALRPNVCKETLSDLVLNEKAGIEIRESGAHREYLRSADGLKEKFDN
ncbi:MAG: NAD(P)-binding domain-containing protein [Bacteroidetes bacterium]|nr:NAD(P)-binding domain-containing protein [Bacteroidota bacterium]